MLQQNMFYTTLLSSSVHINYIKREKVDIFKPMGLMSFTVVYLAGGNYAWHLPYGQ